MAADSCRFALTPSDVALDVKNNFMKLRLV